MILTFSQYRFEQRICSGVKRTTIRADKTDRWKPGRMIQFWMHNPRNVAKNPYFFAVGRCIKIESLGIYPTENKIILSSINDFFVKTFVKINDLNEIAVLDGFDDWEDMKAYFKTDFIGKRITFEIHTILL